MLVKGLLLGLSNLFDVLGGSERLVERVGSFALLGQGLVLLGEDEQLADDVSGRDAGCALEHLKSPLLCQQSADVVAISVDYSVVTVRVELAVVAVKHFFRDGVLSAFSYLVDPAARADDI